MSVISAQDMERYRQPIADIDASPQTKDELISIVHSFLIHLIDIEFGVQADQLSLKAASKVDFLIDFDCASAGPIHEKRHVDPARGGAENDSTDERPHAP